MEKILLTFGTRPFAQRLGNMLSSQYTCYYGSSEPFPDLLLRQRYSRIPTAANPVFVHEVLKTCLDKGCTFVLPLGETELGPLAEARVLFEEYGIAVLVPQDWEHMAVLSDPREEVDVRILRGGIDMITGRSAAADGFSGVVVLSDSEEELAICIV